MLICNECGREFDNYMAGSGMVPACCFYCLSGKGDRYYWDEDDDVTDEDPSALVA